QRWPAPPPRQPGCGVRVSPLRGGDPHLAGGGRRGLARATASATTGRIRRLGCNGFGSVLRSGRGLLGGIDVSVGRLAATGAPTGPGVAAGGLFAVASG